MRTVLADRPAAAQVHEKGPGQKAIMGRTYADGLPAHLAPGLSQLTATGLKAPFFRKAIPGADTGLGEASLVVVGWTTAAANGHELAHHTLPFREHLAAAPHQVPIGRCSAR